VKLVSENCAFDWNANAFGCDMHLVNKSPLPVPGPFVVELQNMMVNLTDFRVENADNGRPGEGARWNFEAPAGARELAPEAQTAVRPFRWKFTGIPEKPEYPFMMFEVVVPNAPAGNRGSSADSN